jgi:sugar phosphate isomerase/epimerase
MVGRNPARYLAPIALAATVTATYVIVHSGLTHKHPTARSATHVAPRLPVVRRRFAKARFYTVRAGDNLSTIAAKTGLTIASLEALNPKIDPNTLQTGQRLRLRR